MRKLGNSRDLVTNIAETCGRKSDVNDWGGSCEWHSTGCDSEIIASNKKSTRDTYLIGKRTDFEDCARFPPMEACTPFICQI